MSRYVFKMPDLGEGTVAAEIVACHVKPGDMVQEEQVILDVMTEKASVEVNSPVSGRVVSIAGKPGQSVPVGAELVVFDIADSATDVIEKHAVQPQQVEAIEPVVQQGRTRVMASPATRRRAREASVELSMVPGTGPGGRIGRDDLERFLSERGQAKGTVAQSERAAATTSPPQPRDEVEEVPIIGVRRLIAQRMSEAVRTIPHFSYVEEIDVTELESLRQHLNSKHAKEAAALTYLPFLALALARVLPRFPQCNARYDAEREVLLQHRSLHLGIATQTANGLKVPVVRNAERRSLYAMASEIRRVSDAARSNKATREELSGSTLTVTSLGKLGGIASTPIINAPEVCIIGVNKATERPVVKHGTIVVRHMMNLSASFDHRFIDGHDAASLVQALKETLEHTALIFADAASGTG
jgi:2-oxoisovalerate dehydrogenase E2 component (dihydrolipoyl transacylase)